MTRDRRLGVQVWCSLDTVQVRCLTLAVLSHVAAAGRHRRQHLSAVRLDREQRRGSGQRVHQLHVLMDHGQLRPHVQGDDSNAGDTAGDRLFTLVAPFSAMHAATS